MKISRYLSQLAAEGNFSFKWQRLCIRAEDCKFNSLCGKTGNFHVCMYVTTIHEHTKRAAVLKFSIGFLRICVCDILRKINVTRISKLLKNSLFVEQSGELRVDCILHQH